MSIDVSDYSGSMFAEVFSGRGGIRKTFIVNGSGSENIDISSLRGGTYTLRVVLDGETHEATFIKKMVLYGLLWVNINKGKITLTT